MRGVMAEFGTRMRRTAFFFLAVVLTACSHGIRAGDTHTVAAATSRLKTWPCFWDKSAYDVWLATRSNQSKEQTLEDNNGLWLKEGDDIRILQYEPPDTVEIAIISMPAGAGKTCWTPTYQGALFSQ